MIFIFKAVLFFFWSSVLRYIISLSKLFEKDFMKKEYVWERMFYSLFIFIIFRKLFLEVGEFFRNIWKYKFGRL